MNFELSMLICFHFFAKVDFEFSSVHSTATDAPEMKWLFFEKSSRKHVSQYTVPTTTAEGSFLSWLASERLLINVKQRRNMMKKEGIV